MNRQFSLVLIFALIAHALFWQTDRAGIVEADFSEARSPEGIALIDMGRVFKASTRFIELREELQEEIKQADRLAKALGLDIQTLETQLKELKPGTDEFNARADALSKKRAELTTYQESQKRHFLQEEATIYKDIYGEVRGIVASYARTHGIRLVVRYQGETDDPVSPQEVIRGLQRSVIYQEGLDISAEVIRILNENHAT